MPKEAQKAAPEQQAAQVTDHASEDEESYAEDRALDAESSQIAGARAFMPTSYRGRK